MTYWTIKQQKESSMLNNFTAKDLVDIINSGFKSNLDQISIGALHIKYKSTDLTIYAPVEEKKNKDSEEPEVDHTPSLEDGSLMITDPMKYEELQGMES